jgi:hypothetical protein
MASAKARAASRPPFQATTIRSKAIFSRSVSGTRKMQPTDQAATVANFAEMIVRHRDIYGAYLGVTGPQYHMMTIIAGTPNTTVGHIAKTMSVSNQFVTSEVGKLAKKDIVEKTQMRPTAAVCC